MMKTVLSAFGALLIGLSLLWTHPGEAWLVQAPAGSPPAFVGTCDTVVAQGLTCVQFRGLVAATATIATALQPAFAWSCPAAGGFPGGSGTVHLTATGVLNTTDVALVNTDCGATGGTGGVPEMQFYEQISNTLDAGGGGGNNGFSFSFASCATSPQQCAFGGHGTTQGLSTAALSVAQPWAIAAVAKPNTNTGNEWLSAKGATWAVGYGGANTAAIYAGSSVQTVAESDASPHALLYVGNGASSAIGVDGTLTTTTATPGANGLSNNMGIGADSGGASVCSCYFQELAIISGGAPNSTQAAAISSTQHTNWGF